MGVFTNTGKPCWAGAIKSQAQKSPHGAGLVFNPLFERVLLCLLCTKCLFFDKVRFIMSTLKHYIKSLGPEQIRLSLICWAKKYLSHDESDIFISELCFVDRARRADLVLANGNLSAFEIKSEKDDLSRWSGQQEDYLSCFESVWLCVHVKHISSALLQTHKDVGLLVVDDFSNISMVREVGNNQSLEAYNLTGFLWRADLDRLAKEQGVDVKSRMRIKEVRKMVASELPVDVVKKFTLDTLKLRYSSSSSSTPPS